MHAGDAKDPKDFATNTMEIAVPPTTRRRSPALDDLAKRASRSRSASRRCPCGKVAAEVFANAGITVKPVTEEVDVKSVLTKVTLGEVDAGMVYVTDVQAAGDKVKGVEIPADQNASTSYPIATLDRSKHEKQAAASSSTWCSPTTVPSVLEEAGFAEPLMPARPAAHPVAAGRPGAARRAAARRTAASGCSSARRGAALGRILGTAGGARRALALAVLAPRLATLISLVLGVPLAWVLARSTMPGLRLLRALVTLPLVLPPGRRRRRAAARARPQRAGRPVPRRSGSASPSRSPPAAVVIAETFVAMPFLVITVEGAFRSADQGYDEAAATLGAAGR